MIIGEYEYRFIYVKDPPFPYGIGMDDPDTKYWVIPRFFDKPTRVYARDYNQIQHPDAFGPPDFEELDRCPEYEHLFAFGDSLGTPESKQEFLCDSCGEKITRIGYVDGPTCLCQACFIKQHGEETVTKDTPHPFFIFKED